MGPIESLESRVLFTAVGVDTTFGVDGVVMTPLSSHGGDVMLTQNSGKVVVGAGYNVNYPGFSGLMERYTKDGKLDKTFGIKGKVALHVNGHPASILAMASQPNGAIVAIVEVGGVSYLERFTANGRLDRNFGNHGVVAMKAGVTALDVRIDGKGQISLAGDYSPPLPDGQVSLDGGPAELAFSRYAANGRPVRNFGTHGLELVDFAAVYGDNLSSIQDFQLLPNGRSEAILTDPRFIFDGAITTSEVQFNADGTPDTSFNQTGQLVFQNGSGGQFLANGSVLSTYDDGQTGNLLVSHYTTQGVLDTAFGTQGRTIIPLLPQTGTGFVADPVNTFIEANGDILVVAALGQPSATPDVSDYSTGLARLTSTGALDTTFGNQGIVVSDDGDAASTAIVTGTHVIVAGEVIPAGTGIVSGNLTLTGYKEI